MYCVVVWLQITRKLSFRLLIEYMKQSSEEGNGWLYVVEDGKLRKQMVTSSYGSIDQSKTLRKLLTNYREACGWHDEGYVI